MLLIDEHSAIDYLRHAGLLSVDERATARPLTGGVSNLVLRIVFADPSREDWVLKQAREQLRVAEPWFCGVERIWREVETLRACADCLADPDSDSQPCEEMGFDVPRVLFEDRSNYIYVMTAAPPEHAVWKQRLLAGETDERIARACGKLLGRVHASTWQNPRIAERFDSRSFFQQLRVDPYYRHVARHSPTFRPWLESLIQSLEENRWTLVHGDFSPKNLLVFDRRILLIDFEVGHYGDPAFDLGFFLTHLVLKSVHAGAPRAVDYRQLATTFWQQYETVVRSVIDDLTFDRLQTRMVQNLAGCLIARVAGKSQAEYLTEAAHQQAAIDISESLFRSEISTWDGVIRICDGVVGQSLDS